MRLTNLRFTKGILPAMILGYYFPLFKSTVGAVDVTAKWTSIWQIFPLSVSLIQYLLANTVLPDTIMSDRIYAPNRDIPAIRLIVGAVTAISTTVWCTIMYKSSSSLVSILFPSESATSAQSILQTDYLLTFAAALLWLAYFFQDLKSAGMIAQSWVTIIAIMVVVTIAAGPGATLGLGWLWREETLAGKRHKAAVIGGWDDGREVVDLKYVDGVAKRANGDLKAANGMANGANGHVKTERGVAKELNGSAR
jgi:hypothetical protein